MPALSPTVPRFRVAARLAVRAAAILVLPAAAAACQTSPAAHSGFLSSYEGLGDRARGGSGPTERRDDVLSDAVLRVYLAPTVILPGAEIAVSAEEADMVRYEVDRQLCYEVSRRFDLAPTPDPDAAVARTAILRIDSTHPAGSAVSAVGGFFVPIPFVSVRVPGATGGLAAESELILPDGRQAAALTWSRNAEVVGRTDASLSRAGDALQMAKPFGGAVGGAFASDAREARPIPDPDPCAHFGPRRDIGRFVRSNLVGAVTGLYVPSVAGDGRPREAQPPADDEQPR